MRSFLEPSTKASRPSNCWRACRISVSGLENMTNLRAKGTSSCTPFVLAPEVLFVHSIRPKPLEINGSGRAGGEARPEEADGNNVTQAVYTLGFAQYGNLVSQRRGGATNFFAFDGLGSTNQLTDITGK